MVLKKKFVTQPSAIASYPFVDVEEGTGNQIYYLCKTAISGATSNILTADLLYSDPVETFYPVPSTAMAEVSNEDFDLTVFNAPKRIRGTANINMGLTLVGNASEYAWAYLKFILHKVSGGGETPIGTVISETRIEAGTTGYYVLNLPMELTQTNVKKGDNLRLEMSVNLSGAGTGSVGNFYVGHDPQNREGTGISPSSRIVITSSNITLPYDLDL